jgi:hypothetical protein
MADITVVSHWYQPLQGLSYSTQEFYTSVEAAIADWQRDDIHVSRVSHQEGGIFSASREYLRVVRGDYTFDCCAAPFGSGFFVSWWLLRKEGLMEKLAKVPILGLFVRWLVKPLTYYTFDSALMFQSAVDGAVKSTLETVCTAKGQRVPTELERKPVLRELATQL